MFFTFIHRGVEIERSINMKKLFNKLRQFIKQYPLLLTLILAGVVYVGLTWWIYRPNTYRTPFYTNSKDYTEVSGAHDFKDSYDYLTAHTNSKVVKKNFVLEEPYEITNYPVTIQMDGYELVEFGDEISVSRDSYSGKGRHVLMAHVTVKNDGDIAYFLRDFASAVDENYSSTKAINTDETFKDYNWKESISSSGIVTLQPHDSHSGTMIYILDDHRYRNLFFEGSFKVMPPEMTHDSGRARGNFTSRYSYIELPIVEEFHLLYMETLKAIPTSSIKRSNSTAVVDKEFIVDQEFDLNDGRLKGKVNRVQFIHEKYRPLYVQEHPNYPDPNEFSLAFDITYTNISGSPLSIDSFQANLARVSSDVRVSTSSNDVSSVVIAPGETFTVSYDNNYLPRDFNKLRAGEEVIISIQDGSRNILGTTTFTLKD